MKKQRLFSYLVSIAMLGSGLGVGTSAMFAENQQPMLIQIFSDAFPPPFPIPAPGPGMHTPDAHMVQQWDECLNRKRAEIGERMAAITAEITDLNKLHGLQSEVLIYEAVCTPPTCGAPAFPCSHSASETAADADASSAARPGSPCASSSSSSSSSSTGSGADADTKIAAARRAKELALIDARIKQLNKELRLLQSRQTILAKIANGIELEKLVKVERSLPRA